MAITSVLGCEDPPDFVALDAGVVVDTPEAGPQGASHGSDDGGVDAGVDSGPGIALDAGPPPCRGDLPAEPYPCEDDADFCDPIGDIDGAARDMVAAWSRMEGDRFVLQVRYAAPPFTIGGQHLNIAIREDADLANDDLPLDHVVSYEETTFWVDVGYSLGQLAYEYPPSFFGSRIDENGVENAFELDPCDGVFVSEDYRTVELWLGPPLLNVQTQPHYWVRTPRAPTNEFPDGFSLDTLVPSRGGQQDAVSFVPLCDAQCPVPGAVP